MDIFRIPLIDITDQATSDSHFGHTAPRSETEIASNELAWKKTVVVCKIFKKILTLDVSPKKD